LNLIAHSIKDQFENVETVYEGNSATYEITTDCGHDASVISEDGTLVCNVKVEFEDASGNNATVTVECKDLKLSKNIRECIQNLAAAAGPVHA